MTGRPLPPVPPSFEWTEEVEAEIFGRIVSGEAVAAICGPDRDDFLPSERTFYRKLAEIDGLWQRYARAREVQAHREFDEIKAIAENATNDTVNVSRLHIDTLKWRAGKLAPKVYGEKLLHANDPDNPMPAMIGLHFVKPGEQA